MTLDTPEATKKRKRPPSEPSILQTLAARETCGRAPLRKFSHAKTFLDMKLNVRPPINSFWGLTILQLDPAAAQD